MVTKLHHKNISLMVHEGQLVSLMKGDIEFFHGAKKPEELKKQDDFEGWTQSEIVMFPLVGPAKAGLLELGEVTTPMDQHGLSRNMPWKIEHLTEAEIVLTQEYVEDTPIINSKQGDEHPPMLSYPFGYRLEKRYSISEGKFVAHFVIRNQSVHIMPYMFGWHPAFKLDTSGAFTARKVITMDEVREASKEKALLLPGTESIVYEDADKRLKMTTYGFGNMMLWTPGVGNFCIEPLTYIPYNDHTGEPKDTEYRTLIPEEEAQFVVEIELV
ncbi:hypothetical protein H6504_01455 [Candidatus Woesearchaeota archaeon]|nr:hypothetical protein [Candidatus Woesearchaeota archaeon]